MFIVDSHCHLDALDYENLHKDIADVVAKAQRTRCEAFIGDWRNIKPF